MEHTTPPFTSLADLASARLGGRVVAANDEFFAPKSNLLKSEPAVFVPGKFTSRGKWMDGWETRRRRTPGHDWCVVKLGVRGVIRGIDVDTSHFTGNYPSHVSVDALDLTPTLTKGFDADERAPWITILPKSPLRGDAHNYLEIPTPDVRGPNPDSRDLKSEARDPKREAWTHIRLNIYPDGGVARLRVYGEVVVTWDRIARGGRPIDLAEIRNGGLVLGASDMHFGAKDNIIMPGRAANIGEGWETRRRRGPGYDWAIVRLGTTGRVRRIEIDTSHFKGNYPESASVEGCLAAGAHTVTLASADWHDLLPRTKLKPDHRNIFSTELRGTGPVSHVRLNIYPDGGVSRLRVYGTVARP